MRPLTCNMPKAMLPVANIPLINYTLSILERYNITNCIISADRFSNLLSEFLGESGTLDFSLSDNPEGTARGLEKAVKYARTDYIIAVNSDVLFDFDLQAVIRHHEHKNCDITLVVKPASNPSDYIIAVTESGVVSGINEHQPRESCVSNLAVTGVMVIRTELAGRISGYGSDIITECIPAMIKEGIKVNTYTETGFWIDVNTQNDYIAANSAVVRGDYQYNQSDIIIHPDEKSGINVIPPAVIAPNAQVAHGAEIHNGSIIGENATVCKGAKIHGGIIMNGAFIGERATVNQAVIGDGAKILSGAAVYEGAVIGSGAVIGENAVVNKGIKIWNGRQIEPYACAANDIKYGFAKPISIDDDGITGETNGIITPQIASVLGSSAVTVGGKIGVGYNETSASKSLALSIASGVMAAGGDVWLFGETTEPELSFCVRTCELSCGCFVDAGVTAKIKFVSSDGLPLTRAEEKAIEAGINRSEYKRAAFMHFGILKNCPEMSELYKNFIRKTAPEKLNGIRAVVNAPGEKISELCDGILKEINDKNGEPIVFHLSSDGRKISAYTDETGYVFHEKLTLLCCQRQFQKGEDIALPYDFPTVADKLAERYGSTVMRYSGCASSGTEISDKEARSLASRTPFVYDAAALMLIILDSLSSNGYTLKKALGELPEFATSNRFVALSRSPADTRSSIEVLRNICAERQAVNDGVVINDAKGRVLIKPVKTGKGIMMHVESYEMEAASELCDFYQDLIVTKFKENCVE